MHLAEQHCKTPEQFKAWSQNLGHENVLTTFASYGKIAPHRQGQVIAGIKLGDKANEVDELFGRLRELVNDSARL